MVPARRKMRLEDDEEDVDVCEMLRDLIERLASPKFDLSDPAAGWVLISRCDLA